MNPRLNLKRTVQTDIRVEFEPHNLKLIVDNMIGNDRGAEDTKEWETESEITLSKLERRMETHTLNGKRKNYL